jgi:hypothetical protein
MIVFSGGGIAILEGVGGPVAVFDFVSGQDSGSADWGCAGIAAMRGYPALGGRVGMRGSGNGSGRLGSVADAWAGMLKKMVW